MSFAELYPTLAPGELIAGTADQRFSAGWAMANAGAFSGGGLEHGPGRTRRSGRQAKKMSSFR